MVDEILDGVRQGGSQGPIGPKGDTGSTGADGAVGQGVPVGGSTNQVLNKIDGTDYNTQWSDASAGSPLTTKGDLFGYSTTDARLPIGANDTILIADSAQTLGVKWGALPNSDMLYGKYRNESSQSVNATSNTKLTWDTLEVEDSPFTMLGNTLTINDDGVYLINLSLNLYGTTTVDRYGGIVSVYVDGVPIANTFQGGYIRGDSGHYVSQIVGVLALTLTASQTIEFYIKRTHTLTTNTRTETGSTLNIIKLQTNGAKGDTGSAGAPGDIIWQGVWSAGTYNQNDTVEHNGSSYVCTVVSTIETPSLTATDWDLVAEKGDSGPAGTTLPYIDLSKTTTQNIGGSNFTKTYITWQTQNYIDTGTFTHDVATNSNRITVDVTGRYAIRGSVAATQGGSARTTEMLYVRVNGTTEYTVGSQNSYSRGAVYGNLIHTRYDWELDLTAGDYVEFYTYIVDTDASYTINTINSGCGVIMRKIA